MSITGPRPMVVCGATEPEAGPVVLTSGDAEDVGRRRRRIARYSVEMFGSACWVTGLIDEEVLARDRR